MSYFSLLLMLMFVVLMMGAVSKCDDDFAPDEDIGLWTDGTDGEEEQGVEYDELDSLPIWGSERVGRIPVNVDSFGAVGDGVADDTQVYMLLLIFIISVREERESNAHSDTGVVETACLTPPPPPSTTIKSLSVLISIFLFNFLGNITSPLYHKFVR